MYKRILQENYKYNFTNKMNNIPMYYINLKQSIHRNKFIQDQILLYQLKYVNRIEGVDGKLLNKSNDTIELTSQKKIQFKNNYNTKNPVIGCVLSHIKAIYNSYNNGDDISIIMEDDVSFALYPRWSNDIQYIINQAPKDWNIITLYHHTRNKFTKTYVSLNDKNYLSCLVYIINRKGMENLLKKIIINDTIYLNKHTSKCDIIADVFIYKMTEHTYFYMDCLFLPYNNNTTMKSSINIDLISHLFKAIHTLQNIN
jgi:GR25 family glycosyltransferase involved in LPS biosynthesis